MERLIEHGNTLLEISDARRISFSEKDSTLAVRYEDSNVEYLTKFNKDDFDNLKKSLKHVGSGVEIINLNTIKDEKRKKEIRE